MNTLKILTLLVCTFLLNHAIGQTDAPKGFENGMIVLADGSSLSGPVKDKIHSNASVVLITDNKKKNYDGSDLLAAEIGGQKFICLKGDFFKIISDGDLKFIQKASDASRKPMYNGNEAVFANGTEGQPGDYFVYSQADKKLKLVNKKTAEAVGPDVFAGCDEAILSAKSAGTDVSKWSEAVSIYNIWKK